jgi:hypothetical protein
VKFLTRKRAKKVALNQRAHLEMHLVQVEKVTYRKNITLRRKQTSKVRIYLRDLITGRLERII